MEGAEEGFGFRRTASEGRVGAGPRCSLRFVADPPLIPFGQGGKGCLLLVELPAEGCVFYWTLAAYAEVPCLFVKCLSWHLLVFLHLRNGLK